MSNEHEIVKARRKEGYPPVSSEHGDINEGDVIPMTRGEAEAREDFEIVEPEHAPKSRRGAPASDEEGD